MPDSADALVNFDGISYAKGASVLRQLVAWVGDEAFLAGIRAHFAAHAFGNATLADLLGALTTASGRDLCDWAELWLRQAGVNTLRVDRAAPAATAWPRCCSPATVLRPHRVALRPLRPRRRRRCDHVRRRVEVDVDGRRAPRCRSCAASRPPTCCCSTTAT